MKKNTYIGIDLGTSSVKLLLVAEDGSLLGSATEEYPVFYPKSGWSEQNPEDWYAAAVRGVKKLLGNNDAAAVRGIGFGGQMHGLVALDESGAVIRPAILWNDGRTQKETDWLNTAVGKETLSAETANIAFAGFTAPKILWMRENEPENFARIAKIMLPKDYLAWRMTGVHCTDYSDASGTLLLDVKNRKWSGAMCEACGVRKEWLPRLFESYEKVGTLLPAAAAEFGLSPDTVVCAGAGDNAAAAVGTGTVTDGACNISLGTSGTVFIARDAFSVDPANALHSFCHANGKYHLMGCILSAASSNAWWSGNILKTDDYDGEQAGLEALLGKNDVYYLPYLMGERSPHNDVNARGAFIGMRADTGRGRMTLAVLEGVAFALRDCVEIAKAGGAEIRETRICGGGAKSALWRRIVADVLNIPVVRPVLEEGPSLGGAMLAMVACGAYASAEEAAARIVRVRDVTPPDPGEAEAYEKKYRVFRSLYPALKDAFAAMREN